MSPVFRPRPYLGEILIALRYQATDNAETNKSLLVTKAQKVNMNFNWYIYLI